MLQLHLRNHATVDTNTSVSKTLKKMGGIKNTMSCNSRIFPATKNDLGEGTSVVGGNRLHGKEKGKREIGKTSQEATKPQVGIIVHT